ncbi:lon protease [Mucor ambiguus]|uniref:Lon protease homolog n=1 Tax=Mucor ambiguus TaxID=91626 RepID=A0A0C9LYN7_9FUNG|nr:lon protease [Mucor ambiguus]
MIPQTLPILPLSNYVLLPSIITTLNVCPTEGQALLRMSSVSYFVCVPFKKENKKQDTSVDLSQLFHYGCVAQIISCDTSVPHQYAIKVKGVCRSRIRDISNSDGGCLYEALLEHHFDKDNNIQSEETLIFNSLCQMYISKLKLIGVSYHVLDQFSQLLTKSHISHAANLLLYLTDSSLGDKLRTLEAVDVKQRLHQVHHAVNSYLQTINTSTIKNKGDEMIFDHLRRKFYILQELHSIDINDTTVSAAGGSDSHFEACSEDDDEIIDLVHKLNANNLPDHAVVAVRRDLNRLRKLPSSSADSAILRTYLEYVSDLPWSAQDASRCELNLNSVREQLDADHFGIDQVKKRILEYLSVLKVKKDATPPIICFVGPPGVGKTTLGKSIASALDRKFHRMALGGVRDEAEIRGHRRTYVGAMPGLLVHGMRQCKVQNPVFLLDEIDKLVTNSNQGDPAAALLEVLDPAQNASFTDHFINIPYDLSQVLFIATANSLDTIPRPLLDRMEVIQLDGYTFNEKLHIATTHLIPKQIDGHGMSFLGLQIPENVVLYVAEKYTRESGVRGLERLIANICRYKCREYADLEEADKADQFDRKVYVHDLEAILGAEPFENDEVESEAIPGVITGLAYSGSGNGGIMMIEANHMPGTGRLKLTGSLGDVIKESAQLAVSWVKANAFALKLTSSPKQDVFQDIDLHIHMPSGAVPKDGPSAGITIVTCLVSLLSGSCVPTTTAMTGEVTLRGQVRPVGGIKEKVISAHRAGIRKVLLPVANKRDIMKDIPAEVKKEMTFVYCKSMWDVIESAFDQSNVRFEPRFTSSL